MKKLSPKVWILLGVFLLQLLIPAAMIGKREATLKSGTPYKFKTRPVDPHDPFRGRYVALGFDEDQVQVDDEDVKRGTKLYAEVYEGKDGFAKIGKASRTRPDDGDYIKVRARYRRTGNKTISVDLPFDRYYMNEKKAPQAESAYRSTNRGTNRNTFAVVRIMDGMSVIEGLYIDGVHVLDYLAKDAEK